MLLIERAETEGVNRNQKQAKANRRGIHKLRLDDWSCIYDRNLRHMPLANHQQSIAVPLILRILLRRHFLNHYRRDGEIIMRILEDEIANDPLVRGYSGMTDAQLLDSLNAEDIDRDRTSMTGREVKSHVDVAEYKALSDAKKQQMIELVKRDDLDLFGLDKDILIDIFGGQSTTGENLDAARVEQISRGEEIGWGVVTAKDFRMHTLGRKAPA